MYVHCPDDVSGVCDISEVPPFQTVEDFMNAGGSIESLCSLLPTGIVLVSETSNDQICNEIITRVYRLSDDCGNNATCSQQIIIDGKTEAGFTIPTDITLTCDQDPNDLSNTGEVAVEIGDRCTTGWVVTFDDVTTGNRPCGEGLHIQRNWHLENECGEVRNGVQNITIIDNAAPEFSGTPQDITVNCDAIPAAPDLTAVDNCDEDVTVSLVENTQGAGCDQVLVRTWTATDDCGNTAVVTQRISIIDTESPLLIGMPADVTVGCGDVPVSEVVLASDNCDLNVQISMQETQQGTDCDLVIIRTWTATDACGNTAIGTQRIAVRDDENPVFVNVPQDQTVSCDDIPVTAVVNATDNCDENVQVLLVESEEGAGCEQVIIRTWTATDDCGNTAVGTQRNAVIDKTTPVVTGLVL